MGKRKDKEIIDTFIIIVEVVIIVVLGVFILFRRFMPPDTAGEYGDIFGGATALFSGLAFAALWFSIQLQKIELRKTVKQLKKSAAEQTELKEINKLVAESEMLTSLLNSWVSTRDYNENRIKRLSDFEMKSDLSNQNKKLTKWIEGAQVRLNRIKDELLTPDKSSSSVNTKTQSSADNAPDGE